MSTHNKLFEDLSKFASGATGAVMDMKREIDAMVKTQVETFASKLDMVSRDEFDAVKAMAEKARLENDALAKRLDALEKGDKKKTTTSKKPPKKS